MLRYPIEPKNRPVIQTNSTDNSTAKPSDTTTTTVEESLADETRTGVQTAFFASLVSLILFTLLVLLDLWLVGVVPATLRAWRSLTSRPAGVQQLLQTLPYYLAVSRSSCQVCHPSSLFFLESPGSQPASQALLQSLFCHPPSHPLLQFICSHPSSLCLH